MTKRRAWSQLFQIPEEKTTGKCKRYSVSPLLPECPWKQLTTAHMMKEGEALTRSWIHYPGFQTVHNHVTTRACNGSCFGRPTLLAPNLCGSDIGPQTSGPWGITHGLRDMLACPLITTLTWYLKTLRPSVTQAKVKHSQQMTEQ